MFETLALTFFAVVGASTMYNDVASAVPLGTQDSDDDSKPYANNDIPYHYQQDTKYFNTPGHQQRRLQDSIEVAAQDRETNNQYLGSNGLYASGSAIENSFGVELGVATHDKTTNSTQRSGLGLYIRSDHLCNKRYDTSVKVTVA
jgi:hypothetical protein